MRRAMTLFLLTLCGVCLGGILPGPAPAEFKYVSQFTPVSNILDDLAVDSDGNVYVSTLISIDKYTSEGTYLNSFGSFGPLPFGIDVGPNNIVYASDFMTDTVYKLNPDGSDAGQVTIDVGGGGVLDVAVLPDGNFYVISAIDPTTIFEFGPAGALLGSFDDGDAGSLFFRLAIDSDGNLYATQPVLNRVVKFAPDHHVIGYYGTLGTGPGQFSAGNPISVAVDSDMRSYVSDFGSFVSPGSFATAADAGAAGRIQQFDPNVQYLAEVGVDPILSGAADEIIIGMDTYQASPTQEKLFAGITASTEVVTKDSQGRVTEPVTTASQVNVYSLKSAAPAPASALKPLQIDSVEATSATANSVAVTMTVDSGGSGVVTGDIAGTAGHTVAASRKAKSTVAFTGNFSADAAGAVRAKLRLTSRARKLLIRKGVLKLLVKATFQPNVAGTAQQEAETNARLKPLTITTMDRAGNSGRKILARVSVPRHGLLHVVASTTGKRGPVRVLGRTTARAVNPGIHRVTIGLHGRVPRRVSLTAVFTYKQEKLTAGRTRYFND